MRERRSIGKEYNEETGYRKDKRSALCCAEAIVEENGFGEVRRT